MGGSWSGIERSGPEKVRRPGALVEVGFSVNYRWAEIEKSKINLTFGGVGLGKIAGLGLVGWGLGERELF